jgi:multidrug efflux pump
VSLSSPFIRRPVATTLLTAAIALAGGVAFRLLPVSPLPQIDFPRSPSLPTARKSRNNGVFGGNSTERQLGHIAGVTEMTSASYLGSTSVTLQFDLTAISMRRREMCKRPSTRRGNLPANLPNNPTYRKVNPADAPT